MDYVPFTYIRKEAGDEYRVDYKSITQAIIISAATGLMVMYGTQKSIMVELDSIRHSVSKIEKNQNNFRRDFYLPRRK